MSVQVIVPLTISNYPDWKEMFDEYSRARVGWSAEGYVIYRSVDDPENVAVIHHFRDQNGARQFLDDPSIQAALARWNNDRLPELHVYEEIDRFF